MLNDIKQLPKDFRKLVTEARAEAAAEIQESLMNRSPFWTGTFNRSWKVQKGSPVAAVKPREGDPEEQASGKLPQKGELIPTELGEDLYIGNQTDYAAFVINQKKHKDDGTMYEDLFKEGRNTTPIPNQPDWYEVYLKTALEQDLDEGFSQTVL